MRCKIFTSSSESKNYGERRYLPHVFTEYGITMLAGLLKSEVAVKVSIEIVNEFIEMKKFIVNNAIVFERVMTIESKVDDKFLEYDKNFNEIFSLLRNEEEFTARIFYEGQIYDSHSILVDIIKSAKKDIVIIDNYITKVVLDLLTNKEDNVDVTIIGKNVLNLPQLDISKFNVQYPSLTIKYSDKYHDRFIIIDGDIVYHIGASLKDLGKKTFAINRINDNSLLGKII